MCDQTARVGTAVLVLDEKSRLLLARRNPAHKATAPNAWGTPGGKVDRGETLEACMRREVLEEIGEPLESLAVIPLVSNEPYDLAHYYCFWGVGRVQSRGRESLDFVEFNGQGVPKILDRWAFFTAEQARSLSLMGWTRAALDYYTSGRTDFTILNPHGSWPPPAG